MAVVSQEVVLFSTTIRQNIMYGNPNATVSDMEVVAKLTNVDRIVKKFPQVNMTTNVFCSSEKNPMNKRNGISVLIPIGWRWPMGVIIFRKGSNNLCLVFD